MNKVFDNISLSREYIHRYIFLLAITIIVVGIPFSRFLMSLGGLLLATNWILENNFKSKWEIIKQCKTLHYFLLLYGVHIVFLVFTNNFSSAMNELLVKIPLLYLPIIFATSQPLNEKEYNNLLKIYVLATILSISCGFFSYLQHHWIDKRSLALYISYARFEINISFACFVAFFLAWNEKIKWQRWILLLIALTMLIFLIYAGYLTALILVFVLSLICLLKYIFQNKNKMLKFSILSIIFIGLIFIVSISFIATKNYFSTNFNETTAEKFTPFGNTYQHSTSAKHIENGNYIYTYVCLHELEEAWNKRSKKNLYELDSNGFSTKDVLIRYLNSKGLHKDRIGVETLTNDDIRNIENGIANYHYTSKWNFVSRFYSVLWEINQYINANEIKGFSLPQRFELWKNSIKIIKEHPILGVGTGDCREALSQKLHSINSPIKENNMKSHNQYLTFLMSFGIVGFIILCISIFYTLSKIKFKTPIFKVFLFILFVSMLTEDTLGQQDGVTLFAFFYCYFLFLYKPEEKKHLEMSHTMGLYNYDNKKI